MTVDEALEFADRARAREIGLNDYEFDALHLIASEFRRLRELHELAERGVMKMVIEQDWAKKLQAKLARVEASDVCPDCLAEIGKALRDESQPGHNEIPDLPSQVSNGEKP